MIETVAYPPPNITQFTHFLEWDRPNLQKNEYLNQKIRPMAGASKKHNLIAFSLANLLYMLLNIDDHEIYYNDMRLHNPLRGSFFFPDIMVIKGEAELLETAEKDVALNPTLLIEVLSASTEVYDRTEKFVAYKEIATLEQYVLVAQDRLYVEIFTKNAQDQWQYSWVADPEATVRFSSVGFECKLKEIYAKVRFDD
jgi:Uma2 family endonuclease